MQRWSRCILQPQWTGLHIKMMRFNSLHNFWNSIRRFVVLFSLAHNPCLAFSVSGFLVFTHLSLFIAHSPSVIRHEQRFSEWINFNCLCDICPLFVFITFTYNGLCPFMPVKNIFLYSLNTIYNYTEGNNWTIA